MRREVHSSSTNFWPGLGRPFAEDVCLPLLRIAQNSDGGWGFTPRAPSCVEPTCWSLLALAREPRMQSLLDSGRAWLERVQLRDGAWPAHPGSRQGCWVTALACLALHASDRAPDAVDRGARWLCRFIPAEAGFARRLGLRLGAATKAAAFGWNCAAGGGESAVEPTAASLLLLQSLPAHLRPRGAARRMDYARDFLHHTLFASCSVDSSSPDTSIHTAAWALLALRDDSYRAEFQDRLDWLQRAATASRGPLSLSLGQLALRACGRRTDMLDGRLARLHSNNQFLNQIAVVAVAHIAVNPLPPWAIRQPTAAIHSRVLLQRV